MIQTLNIIGAFIMSSAIALSFGIWMNNIHAGIFAFSVSFYTFVLKYDNN